MSEGIRHDLTRRIYELRKQYDVWGEIKWSKVSRSKLEFYKRLIDLFLETKNMPYFRCICIDSRKVDNGLFNVNTGIKLQYSIGMKLQVSGKKLLEVNDSYLHTILHAV